MKCQAIGALCREAAIEFTCSHPFLVISITDPGWDFSHRRVEFSPCAMRLDVLHLSFYDFYAKHFRIQHEGQSLRQWAMRPWQASCAWEFVERWSGKFHTLVVHCEAGVSRSPSMALAIAEHLGVNRDQMFPAGDGRWEYQPLNPWVYELTLQEFSRLRMELRLIA